MNENDKQAEPNVLPGEAVVGFAAWLTSLKAPVTFSECHGAAIGADLAAAYNKSQGFDEIREDFHKRLRSYPKQEPAQQVEPDFKAAYMEWHDKTEWVQEKKDWPSPVMGMHRADAMKKYIEHLESNQSAPAVAVNEQMLTALELARFFVEELTNAAGKYAGLEGQVVADAYLVNAKLNEALVAAAEAAKKGGV